MTSANSDSRYEAFNDFLDREMAERKKERFRKLNDEKKYIVRPKKKRRSIWKRIRSLIS